MDTDPGNDHRWQLVRLLTTGRLSVHLSRRGAHIVADNAIAILAAIFVVVLVIMFFRPA